MTEAGSAADGSSGSMAAGAYHPAASVSSTGSSYSATQPGQPAFHYPSDAAHAHAMHRNAQQQQQQQQPQQLQRSPQFGDASDAPKPLQFTNRQ